MTTMTVTEIRDHATRVFGELEELRIEVERSSHRPDVKSALTREICESQARVRNVLQACGAGTGAAVLAPAV